MMMLSETIEQLATTTQATGRSHQTVQSYREKLGHLCDFLGDVSIEDVTAADLQRYVIRRSATFYLSRLRTECAL